MTSTVVGALGVSGIGASVAKTKPGGCQLLRVWRECWRYRCVGVLQFLSKRLLQSGAHSGGESQACTCRPGLAGKRIGRLSSLLQTTAASSRTRSVLQTVLWTWPCCPRGIGRLAEECEKVSQLVPSAPTRMSSLRSLTVWFTD
ncbi:hypothetical protein BaRGS_00037778 [Batillaria attramentaria]|uniref:Uncharacterized protein n=1 Tax=Batillaria attramentaria TaxID=370345 RepID=A0ABD0J7T1_9CAEN